jgi:oligopeptidase A
MLLASKLDLELHMHYMERYSGRPLDEVTNEIVGPWLFPYTVQPPSELRTLTHVFSEGYAACLYTYKWCEVLAADAFSRFRQEGILNPATGAAYRRAILNRGSSIPAAEQIREFLGRDPSPEALIRQYTQP